MTEKKRIDEQTTHSVKELADDWEELIRSDFALYNVSIPLHSIQYSNAYIGGPKYDKLLLYIEKDVGYYYENFKDHQRVGDYCLDLFLNNPSKYTEYITYWRSEKDAYSAFLDEVKEMDLTKLSNNELTHLLEKIYIDGIKWHGIAYNVDAIDTVLNPLVQGVIERAYSGEKKSRHAEIYSKLTFPQELSYMNRMQWDRLKLFKEIHEKGFDSCAEKITAYLKTFYWVNFKWGDSDEYTLNEFNKEWNELGQGDVSLELEEMTNRFERAWKEKKEIVDTIREKEPIIDAYMKIFEDYAIFHDLRKEGQVKAVYMLRKCYHEAASRLEMKAKQAYYWWPAELVQVLRGEKPVDMDMLRKRTQQWFCEYYATGEWKEYFGKEALAKRNAAIGLNTDALKKEIDGVAASQGRVIGRARVCLSAADAVQRVMSGDILVTGMTMPEFVPAMMKAAAIVTDEGGLTCHAAIISRELGKPCVVGTRIATRMIRDGDLIEVNANHGVIKLLTEAEKK